MNNRHIARAYEIFKDTSTIYLNKARFKKTSFSRDRKLPIHTLCLQMFANKGKSLKNECHDFFNEYHINGDVTSWGYIKRRLEFNPEALQLMNHDYVKKIYQDKNVGLTTLNDYYVLAIDGSDITIPSTEENYEVYGKSEGKSLLQPAMASISCLYDCINKHILDIQVNKYKFSERQSAKIHIEEVKDIIEDKKIFVFDRGYFSVKLLFQLLDNNDKFLFRLDSKFLRREQNSMIANDEIITVEFDYTRTYPYHNDKELVNRMQNSRIPLRFVKIPLEDQNGEIIFEFLLTNLSFGEFETDDIGELYHLRWEIETSYRVMKSQMKLEQFSGYRSIIIAQDIFITAFLYNMIQGIITEEKKIIPEDKYKYQMEINKSYSIGIIKSNIIKMILYYDKPKKQKEIMSEISKQINRYIVPIRPDRKVRRKRPINKCKMSYKSNY